MIKYPNGGIPHQHVSRLDDDGKEMFWPMKRQNHDDLQSKRVLACVVVHGDPVQAGRPRFSNGHAYDPKRSRDYKRFVSQEAKLKYHGPILRDKALKVDVKVYRHVQRSISKVERGRRLRGEHRPIVKPDASNYLKLVEDALTGIVWEDDNLITDVSCHKYYSDEPRIEVTVTEAKEEK